MGRTATRRALLSRPVVVAEATWSPLDLSPSLWWDCSDATQMFTDAGTTPVSSDGQGIYRLGDKSGNSRYVEQETEANRPLYKVNIQNELSAALGVRASALFWARSTISWEIQEWWLVAALNATNITYDALVGGAQGESKTIRNNNTNALRLTTVDGGDFTNGGGAGWIDGVSTEAVTYDQFFICRAQAPSARTYTSIKVLVEHDFARYWASYLGEAIGFSSALSTANANLLGAYLADKWGLSWTPIA